MAIITNIGAPISPADTVASPMTMAPMIDTAWPTTLGNRSPASRMIS